MAFLGWIEVRGAKGANEPALAWDMACERAKRRSIAEGLGTAFEFDHRGEEKRMARYEAGSLVGVRP